MDDAPALQRAIDAAQRQNRALLLPAGSYTINATLLVRCCRKGTAPMVPPLRLIGEGPLQTLIEPGRQMTALIAMTGANDTVLPGLPGKSTAMAEYHEISQIYLNAQSLADYALLAPVLSRGRIADLKVIGAVKAGVLLGGWINSVIDCMFTNNGIALQLETFNAVSVTRCALEGSHTAGLLANDGHTLTVTGATIEGNGGPGVVANGVAGLSFTGNYLEGNNRDNMKGRLAEHWPTAAGDQQVAM